MTIGLAPNPRATTSTSLATNTTNTTFTMKSPTTTPYVIPKKEAPRPPAASNKPPAIRPRGRPRKDSVSVTASAATGVAPKKERNQSLSDDDSKQASKGGHKERHKEATTESKKSTATVAVESDDDEYICPQCERPDDGTPMIGCDRCDEWYHWQCVGVFIEPKADQTWMCTRCKKKKQSVRPPPPSPQPPPLLSKQSAAAAIAHRSLSTSPIISLTKYSAGIGGGGGAGGSSQWQCPACRTSVDNTTPSICCDDCDRWYHFDCAEIKEEAAPQEDESWFCRQCIEKQAAIAYKFAKVKRI